MRKLTRRALGLACWCWIAGAVLGTGLTAAAEGVQTARHAAEELAAWTAYVYAAERTEASAAYLSGVVQEAEQARILLKFGLVSSDMSDAMAVMRQEAESRLLEHERKLDEASAGLALHYASLTPDAAAGGTDAPVGPAAGGAAAAAEPRIVPAEHAPLQDAKMNEELAAREAKTAALLRKSGSLDAWGHLDKQQAYLAARLRAIDAREAAALEWQAPVAAAEGHTALRAWLGKLEAAGDASLIRGWMNAIARYAAQPYEPGSAGGGAASLPAGLTQLGGQSAASLPLHAVALAGKPVKLTAAPVRTGTGEIYVPLRPYAEALQYKLAWDAKQALLTLTRGGDRIELRPGDRAIRLNGQEAVLPAEPLAERGHTYVPLSFFGAAADCDVYWNDGWRQGIIITRAIGVVE